MGDLPYSRPRTSGSTPSVSSSRPLVNDGTALRPISRRDIEPYTAASATALSAAYHSRARADVVEAARRCEMSGSVLDVGCAAGMVGAMLLERGLVDEVTGIEMNPAVAQLASSRLTHVITGDATVPAVLPPGPFDGAILADVLEHLAEPEQLLARVLARLRANARVVVSLPNVQHFRVIADLALNGTWRYTEEGICDRTHLRFFTFTTALELLDTASLRPEVVLGTMTPRAARLCARVRAAAPFLANQFVFGCTRMNSDQESRGGEGPPQPTPSPLSGHDTPVSGSP